MGETKGGLRGKEESDKSNGNAERPRRKQDISPSILTSRSFILFVCLIAPAVLIQYVVVHSYFPEEDSRSAFQAYFPSFTPSAPSYSTLHQPRYDLKCDFNLLHKDAKSSLKRAKTTGCLQKIADAACKNLEGTLYPPVLEAQCKREVDKAAVGKYVGCYKEAFEDRLLTGSFNFFEKDNSAKR